MPRRFEHEPGFEARLCFECGEVYDVPSVMEDSGVCPACYMKSPEAAEVRQNVQDFLEWLEGGSA